MDNLITVVKVTRHADDMYKVWFSKPVHLGSVGAAGGPWWCEKRSTDELGAYLWGLEVIKQHYERINKEQTNVT